MFSNCIARSFIAAIICLGAPGALFASESAEIDTEALCADWEAKHSALAEKRKHATIYTWVDDDGITHFSESLPEGVADVHIATAGTSNSHESLKQHFNKAKPEDPDLQRFALAQKKVTEMYLNGLNRRLETLKSSYRSDPDNSELVDQICRMQKQIDALPELQETLEKAPPDPPTIDTSNMANRQ